MYYNLSKALWDLGVPTIPLFKTSKLPAVPAEKIPEANQALINNNWRTKHQSKSCGLPLGIPLPQDPDYAFIALVLDNALGDIKMDASRNLPTGAWQISNARHTYLVYRCHVSELQASESYYIPGRSEPLVSILASEAFVKMNNHLQIPTPDMLAGIPALTPFDLINWMSALPNTEELYSEPAKRETTKPLHSLSQLDVKMRIYIAHFLYDFLLNCDEKTSLLPVLQEVEAIYDSFSASFDYIPPNHQKEAYFQAFYGLFYEQKMLHGLLLPPNWGEGIGTQYREKYNIPFKKNDSQLTFDRLKDDIYMHMSEAIGSDQAMLKACQRSVDEIGRAFTLTKLEEDQLKKYISRQSGMKLNMNKMETQIRQHKNRYRGTLDVPTIIDRVLSFLNSQSEYRYDVSRNSQKLFRWNGIYWEVVDDYEIMNLINTYFGSDLTTKNSRNVSNIITSIKQQLALPLRRVSATGVNFNNGFLSSDLQLQNHDPDMGLTYALPFTYLPGQTQPPPKFKALLKDIWGEAQASIDALQEAMAVTFFNMAPAYQRAFLLYGAPNTGKSQLLNIIKQLIPANMRVAIAPENWNDSEHVAGLSDKLLNLCGELSESQYIHSKRFKDIVDGNEVTLKKTATQHLSLNPITAHWFASNHLPKTKDFSEGFTRRWLILHFTKVVNPNEVLIDIGNKIVADEKDEIISWALQAYPRLIDNGGYTLPESHCQLAAELGQMNNNVRFFMEVSGAVGFDTSASISVLRSLPKEDLLHELNNMPYITGRDLYTLYQATVRAFKNGSIVDEPEFYRRTRELSSLHDFMQIVGRDAEGRPTIRYYGLTLSK